MSQENDIGIIEYGHTEVVRERSWKQWLAFVPLGAAVAANRYIPPEYRAAAVIVALVVSLALHRYWGRIDRWVPADEGGSRLK